ncbi:MAG: YgaP family membrane protein [Polaribacter sp.]
MEKNISKLRAHDAIVGILYLVSVGLTLYTLNLDFLWIALAVGGLQLISPITKFCPVYSILNKLMPNTDPIQNGK